MEYQEFKLLKVLEDRLIVQRVPEEEMSGGIYFPDSSKVAPTEGVVVALGNTLKQGSGELYCDVKLFDRVLFSRYCGVEFKMGGRKDPKFLVILRLGDIHGLFTEEVKDTQVFEERQPEWKV